jgi:hypothetical protein
VETGKERLASEATSLKKAWIVSASLVGYRFKVGEFSVPNYLAWQRRPLLRQVADLRDDLTETLERLVTTSARPIGRRAVDWLAGRFEPWADTGFGVFTVSTVFDFERLVGTLKAHKVMDVPPYAEMLVQPSLPVAFRHPEYMLARDLAVLLDFFKDTESLLRRVTWTNPPNWAMGASENGQALARAVIQSCFNLLESFTSGLAQTYLLTHSRIEASAETTLRDTRSPLGRRVLDIPNTIVGRPSELRRDTPPISTLFGKVKRYRDAFVHCEPGPMESTRGYVKEALFHDVSSELVEETVNACAEVIRKTWLFVYRRRGPSWLPDRDSAGSFGRKALVIVPSTPGHPAGGSKSR